jgi:hypothetical protein
VEPTDVLVTSFVENQLDNAVKVEVVANNTALVFQNLKRLINVTIFYIFLRFIKKFVVSSGFDPGHYKMLVISKSLFDHWSKLRAIYGILLVKLQIVLRSQIFGGLIPDIIFAFELINLEVF